MQSIYMSEKDDMFYLPIATEGLFGHELWNFRFILRFSDGFLQSSFLANGAVVRLNSVRSLKCAFDRIASSIQ